MKEKKIWLQTAGMAALMMFCYIPGQAQVKDSLHTMKQQQAYFDEVLSVPLPGLSIPDDNSSCMDLLLDVLVKDLEVLVGYFKQLRGNYNMLFDEYYYNEYITQNTIDKYRSLYNNCLFQIDLMNSKIQQARITCNCDSLSTELTKYNNHFNTYMDALFAVYNSDPHKAVTQYSDHAMNYAVASSQRFIELLEQDIYAMDAAYNQCGK